MGIIYYLNKLNPGLYYLHNGRDGLINWDSDIKALQFASSKFEELDTHFSFEFSNLKFPPKRFHMMMYPNIFGF